MAWRQVASWWRRLTQERTPTDEIDAELRFHLEMEAERNLTSGMEPREARRAANRDFGGIEQYKEECRDQRRASWVHSVWQDIRYGVRILGKAPGFTALAVLSLASGIGATTAMFSVTNAVFLRPLPYKDADRIVRLWEVAQDRPDQKRGAMVRNFLAWKERNTVFEDMAGLMLDHTMNLNSDQNPEVLKGRKFTPGFLDVFGVKPALGRPFLAEEYDNARRDWPLIISYGFWERRFAKDPNVIGKTLPIEGLKQPIVGVMPKDYQPLYWAKNIDFWGPRTWSGANITTNFRWLPVFAKLRPGVTIEQAQAAMSSIAEGLAREDAANTGWTVKVEPLYQSLLGFRQPAVMPIAGGVGLVLLIACANVAGLLLGRTSGRQREIAIRLSIGAGRLRIARQLLTESLLLALAGGIAGLLFARWFLTILIAAAPPGTPRLEEASIDVRVLAFTLAVAVATGVLFGLVPALTGSRFAPGPGFDVSARSFGGSRQRMRRVLVAGEVAVAMVLLTGAGLLLKSFLRLSGIDVGFEVKDVVAFRLKVPERGVLQAVPNAAGESLLRVPEQMAPGFERILEEMRALPGVRAGAIATFAPMTGMFGGMPFTIEGNSGNEGTRGSQFQVSAGFFDTLGVPLLQGRDFLPADTQGGEWVAIINDAAAKRYWANRDPIGAWIAIPGTGAPRRYRIVGVVRNFRYGRVDQAPNPTIYTPHQQQPLIVHSSGWLSQVSRTFLLRVAVPPDKVLPGLRAIAAKHTGNQPIFDVQTVEDLQGEQYRAPRFGVTLVGVFAAFGVILAAAGVFSVMTYAVVQRSREIGLRMALGAQRAAVARMILGEGLKVAAAGIVLGLAGSLAAGRVLAKLLFEINPQDPSTLASVSLLFLCVILLACSFPVRRATAVDPVEVLRHE
ncbi:MAG TPA: ABC transporter permease [Bryobacteraceae bacterium]|nr:ABC transporter permease [Bryobacteraceae bacterium]